MKKRSEWGLAIVHREDWDFGRSWSLERFSAHLVEPQVQPLIGFPKTWSVGTAGAVTADVVRATLASEADLARYKGRLKGKIVLSQPSRAVRMLEGPIIVRMDGDLAKEAEATPVPAQRGRGGPAGRGAPAARRGDAAAVGAGPASRREPAETRRQPRRPPIPTMRRAAGAARRRSSSSGCSSSTRTK